MEAFLEKCFAEDGFEYIRKQDGLYFVGDLCERIVVDVPDKVCGIQAGSFFNHRAIRSITIPKSVKRIGINAFPCSSLRNVTFDDESVYLIDKSAFEGCELESFIAPKSLRVIEANAFAGCMKFKKVVLNNGLRSICDFAFAGAVLSEIVIPKSVKDIGMGALCFDDNTVIRFEGHPKNLLNAFVLEARHLNRKSEDFIANGKPGHNCFEVYVDGEMYIIPKGIRKKTVEKCNGVIDEDFLVGSLIQQKRHEAAFEVAIELLKRKGKGKKLLNRHFVRAAKWFLENGKDEDVLSMIDGICPKREKLEGLLDIIDEMEGHIQIRAAVMNKLSESPKRAMKL